MRRVADMDGMPHEIDGTCCGRSTYACPSCGSQDEHHCQGAYYGMMYLCERCEPALFAEISDEDYERHYGVCGNYDDPAVARRAYEEASQPDRDLLDVVARAAGEHHLPAELAALGEPELHPAVRELLEILAEECAETIQRVTKILCFGFRVNPWTGEHNRDTLELEFGDVTAIGKLLIDAGAMRGDVVIKNMRAKLRALGRRDGRLRSAVVDDSGNLVGAPLVVISQQQGSAP